MRRSLVILAAATLLGGCHHVTVTSGPQPTADAPATVIQLPYSNAFVWGLVPPPEANVRAQCPNGVAKVETRHSAMNVLVSVVTVFLYTPVEVKVTCTP